MLKFILILFVFLRCIHFSTCRVAIINATALDACVGTYNCDFNNASLWQDNLPPNNNDSVIIAAAPSRAYLRCNVTELTLTYFTMQGNVTFVLLGSSRLIVTTSVSIADASWIGLMDNSIMVSQQVTNIADGSVLELVGTGGFEQGGSYFRVTATSVLSLTTGYINLNSNFTYLNGLLEVLNGASFVATGLVYFQNNQFLFLSTPEIRSASFSNSSVNFTRGWYGAIYGALYSSNVTIYSSRVNPQVFSGIYADSNSTISFRGIDCNVINTIILGTLLISSSFVNVFQLTQPLNANIIFGGTATLICDSIILNTTLFTVGERGEAPYVTLYSYNFTAAIPLTIPNGDLVFFQNAFISSSLTLLQGNVVVTGRLAVTGNLTVGGTVRVGGDVVSATNSARNVAVDSVNATLVLSWASIVAQSLILGQNATLLAHLAFVTSNISLHSGSTLVDHNSTYNGNIYNDGQIPIKYLFTISGNYTQGRYGVLTFEDIDLANNVNGVLNVIGSAELNGTIAYTLQTLLPKPGKTDRVVIQAQRITGKFKTKPLNQGLLKISSDDVDYGLRTVSLRFEKTSGSSRAPWWVWFLVAIGFTVVITIGVVYFILKKRGSGYLRIGSK